jgi:hypothetical protein
VRVLSVYADVDVRVDGIHSHFDPEPIDYRRVSVGALLQTIEHVPLNNLLNVLAQTANKVGFQGRNISH